MAEARLEKRRAFWEGLTKKIDRESDVLPSTFDNRDSDRPERGNYRSWRILPARATLGVNVRFDDRIYVYLYLGNGDTEGMFRHLRDHQAEIDAAFESPLRWRPDGSGARIRGRDKILLVRDADVVGDNEHWDQYQHWLVQTAERFYGVFSPHLRNYENQ